MAKVTIHLVVCTVFASCCPVSWPQRDATSEDWHQPGMGWLVDHLGKDHHTTWWCYDIRCDFFSVGRCSHTRLWPLFGDFLGSLNMGMVLGGLLDHDSHGGCVLIQHQHWLGMDVQCRPQKWAPQEDRKKTKQIARCQNCTGPGHFPVRFSSLQILKLL